jgi:FtsH-binding integral membrane protein
VHDTVTLLLGFHPIRFANTWYLYFLNEHGVTLPFWVTGVVVLGALGVAGWLVHRRQPGLGELLRWLAFVLLVANLVNKQAFYNQFWLSAALVAVSVAVPVRQRSTPLTDHFSPRGTTGQSLGSR